MRRGSAVAYEKWELRRVASSLRAAVSNAGPRSGRGRRMVGPKTGLVVLPGAATVSRARFWFPGRGSAVYADNTTRRFARALTGATGLEPATSGVTGRRSNQLNYAPRGR